jgi:hypothetical protein
MWPHFQVSTYRLFPGLLDFRNFAIGLNLKMDVEQERYEETIINRLFGGFLSPIPTSIPGLP